MGCIGIGRTDIGLIRGENEDAFLIDDDLGFFAVADGMGGLERGTFASNFAVGTLHEMILKKPMPPGREEAALWLKRAMRAVSDLLRRLGGTNTGTTLVAVVVRWREAYIASLGDSRAYLLRKDDLGKITEDHNLAAQMVAAGKITPEEARRHPSRSVVTAYVGMEDASPETTILDLEPGDEILLCTDGLWSALDEPQISRILRENSDTAMKLKELIESANAAGGEDNTTAVIIDCPGF